MCLNLRVPDIASSLTPLAYQSVQNEDTPPVMETILSHTYVKFSVSMATDLLYLSLKAPFHGKAMDVFFK